MINLINKFLILYIGYNFVEANSMFTLRKLKKII